MERPQMEPHIDVITLAVADLERSREFYRDGLGLDSAELVGAEYPGDDVTPAGAAAMFKFAPWVATYCYTPGPSWQRTPVFGSISPRQSGEFSIGHA